MAAMRNYPMKYLLPIVAFAWSLSLQLAGQEVPDNPNVDPRIEFFRLRVTARIVDESGQRQVELQTPRRADQRSAGAEGVLNRIPGNDDVTRRSERESGGELRASAGAADALSMRLSMTAVLPPPSAVHFSF
jgi:hypothetical protein